MRIKDYKIWLFSSKIEQTKHIYIITSLNIVKIEFLTKRRKLGAILPPPTYASPMCAPKAKSEGKALKDKMYKLRYFSISSDFVLFCFHTSRGLFLDLRKQIFLFWNIFC